MLVLAAMLLLPQQEVPRLTSPVSDLGGVLYPEDEETALHMIRKIAESHSVEFSLVTVNRTAPRDIDGFTAEVAKLNGLRPNGVLIVVAVKDRRARIAVGAHLEDSLPGPFRDRIIGAEMVPHFIYGRIGAGTFAGMAAMVAAVRGDYRIRSPVTRYRRRSLIPGWGYLILAGIYVFVIHRKLGEFGGGFAIGRSARRIGRSPDFQGGGSSGSWC